MAKKKKTIEVSAQSLDALAFNINLLIGLLAEVYQYSLTVDENSKYVWVPNAHYATAEAEEVTNG